MFCTSLVGAGEDQKVKLNKVNMGLALVAVFCTSLVGAGEDQKVKLNKVNKGLALGSCVLYITSLGRGGPESQTQQGKHGAGTW